jgi:EmrB/QacA subfamily drug resistance transporter
MNLRRKIKFKDRAPTGFISFPSFPNQEKWLALATVALGTFMATTAINIVNIGLPAITRAFHTDMSLSQWVLISYLFTTSSFLLNFGKLGDLYGRGRIYSFGLIVFSITSGICGISLSIHQLILFRILQAIGAAMIIGTGAGLVVESFPPDERGKALGIYSALAGISLTIGPSLGGFLIHAFSWRLIFLVNVPLGIIGGAMAILFLNPGARAKQVNFDIIGGILLPLFLLSFLLVFHFGQNNGWSSPIVLFFTLTSILFLFLFITGELKSPYPLLDLKIFRNRVFTAGQISNFLNHLAVFAVMFIMPFYLVDILSLSEAKVGLIITPLTLGMIVVSPASGWLSDRIGTGIIGTIGFVLICLGLFSLSTLTLNSTPWGIVARLSILGIGRGIFSSPNNSAIMGSVRKDQYGIAGAMTANLRHLGNVSGVAIIGALFAQKKSFYLSEFQNMANITLGEASQRAFIMAFHDTLILATVISALGIFAAAIKAKA